MSQIIALIPAYNEERELGHAVSALETQSRPPDRIIVALNNARPGMLEVARSTGAEVFDLGECPGHKAEALNRVLSGLLPTMNDDDVVLVQDADSFLDPLFIEKGMTAYTDGVGGVGGVFRGRVESENRWSRILEAFQANEYSRYELDIRRQRGRVLVLTGTATLLKAGVLREVIESRRAGILPGSPQVYDTRVLTEDNELSFALMDLGYKLKSPSGCTLSTETMTTLRALANQRLRWKRGAIENLMDYGWTKWSRPYWGRQALAVAGLIVTIAYLGTLVFGIAVGMSAQPLWIGVTVLFGLERAVTVRKRGIRQMLVGAVVFVEFGYDLFLQGVQAIAYIHALTGKERRW